MGSELKVNPGDTVKHPHTVVTGGAGFLGSHLCDYLLGKGHRVTCIDNLLTGTVDNIAHLAGNKDFRFIKQDVTEYVFLPGAVDNILHFASPASPMDFTRFPIQILKVGALGTHKALGLAREKKARFLLASTSEVYGDPEVHPQKEDYLGNVNPVGVRGVYDEAKRFAEALTMAYHRTHGIDTKIARIFNTYGPRMRLDDGRVLPQFMTQALRNEDITVFGDGSQTRCFIYVSDLIGGLHLLLESDEHMPTNIGSTDEVSILDFAREIIKLTGSGSRIATKALPQDDPKRRKPDITRARELLGWEPKVPRSQGLTVTLEYFREKLAEINGTL